MEVFKGTIADIKKIYPKKVGEVYNIIIMDKDGCKYLDSDVNTWPVREPYVCATREQAVEYCDMILEGVEVYERSKKEG
jgi:hypothetical protein